MVARGGGVVNGNGNGDGGGDGDRGEGGGDFIHRCEPSRLCDGRV